MRYGDAPLSIGTYDLRTPELMFVQYMPVRMPFWSAVRLPRNVMFAAEIVTRIADRVRDCNYIYLTAKRLHVSPGCPGNRPGWHSDGFGTFDVNYIWYDSAPTEFCVQPFDLSDDCDESLRQMDEQAKPENIRTYPPKTLLRLTPSCIHRVAPSMEPGYRTFMKVSVSPDRYDGEGNAHNYLFDYDWPMRPRAATRNHPSGDRVKT